MKRIVYILIPLILVFIIVFGVIKIFILDDDGKGALQVTSQPLSKVYLNDVYLGNTPLCRCESTTMLKNGDYTVKLIPLEKSLPEFQEKIHITEGVLTVVDRKFGKGGSSEGSIISLTPLNAKNATELLVLSFPDKAEVLIDSTSTGETPILSNKLTNSDHTVKLRKTGYKDKSVRVRTPPGYRLTATIYLSLRDGSAPSQQTPTVSAVTPTASVTAPAARILILPTPNGFLRVRQSPSLTGLEVARVNSGESYPMVAEQADWFQIRLTNGTIGWVSSQYASKE